MGSYTSKVGGSDYTKISTYCVSQTNKVKSSDLINKKLHTVAHVIIKLEVATIQR